MRLLAGNPARAVGCGPGSSPGKAYPWMRGPSVVAGFQE